MYNPIHFNEDNAQTVRKLITHSPLATFIIHTPDGLIANHLPFIYHHQDSSPSQLHAHIPRANALSNILTTAHPCLAIFHGAEGYISPSYYASKQKHGKVVPTWNYQVIHVHGNARIIDDNNWIQQQIIHLTEQHEQDREKPWAVSDAPLNYINASLKALMGIEVSITHIEGKTKASQNQPLENKESILKTMQVEQPHSELHQLMKSALK